MKSKRYKKFDVTYLLDDEMKKMIYYTICKKDKLPHYKQNNSYFCIDIDQTAKCVLFDGFDNLIFTNSEFDEFFYSKLDIRKLKIQKLNNI